MPTEMPIATKEAMILALIDGDPVHMRALDSTHGYTVAAAFLDDIVAGSYLGDEEVLTSVDATGGYFRTDPASLTSILTTEFIDALVVYVWKGSAATSPILVFVDTLADNTDMNREGVTGEPVSAYPPDYIFRI